MSTPNILGGGARHTKHYRHFNHEPEAKPWVRLGAQPSAGARAIIAAYMGPDFPIETIEWDIIESIEQFADLGAVGGLKAYLDAIGPEGCAVLAAIKRNFDRHPERWRKAVS